MRCGPGQQRGRGQLGCCSWWWRQAEFRARRGWPELRVRALIEQAGLTRAVIAGDDTSSHALRQLEIFALTTRLPLPTTPGSPLCVTHSDHRAFDGLEIGLKGGQVGNDD